MSTSLTRRMVLAALAASEEKKAEDIRVLELDPVDSAFTDFFLICSGTNSRQNQAIAQEIELRMKREFGAYANSVEGYRQAEWILLDYVDFVVHIFATDKREAYNIERLRKTANSVSMEELKASLIEKVAAVRKSADSKKPDSKKPDNKKAAPTPASVAPTAAGMPKKSAAKKVIKKTAKKTAVKKAVKKIVKKAAKPAAKKAVKTSMAGKKTTAAKKQQPTTKAKKTAAKKLAPKKAASKAGSKTTKIVVRKKAAKPVARKSRPRPKRK